MNKARFLAPIGAFVFFTILFCLPGSAFPKEDWFSKFSVDKWVHISIFTLLVFLWSNALQLTTLNRYLLITLAAIAYGYAIEIIQDRFIPNRDFDWGDLLADFVGSLTGVLCWKGYKKNRPL